MRFRRLTPLAALLFFTSGALAWANDDDKPSNVSPLQHIYLLKQIKPDIKQVGVLCELGKHPKLKKKLERVGAQMQLKIVLIDTKKLLDVSKNFKRLAAKMKVDAVWIFPDEALIDKKSQQYLVKQAVLNKVILISPIQSMVKKGATLYTFKEDAGLKIYYNQNAITHLQLTIPESLTQIAEVISL